LSPEFGVGRIHEQAVLLAQLDRRLLFFCNHTRVILTEADLVSREELYGLVWSMPMIKVAEKFKVSGSYMARACSILRVPRPERGYWAKLAVGKAPERPPLPETQPGDQLSWSQGEELQLPPRPRLETPPSLSRPRLQRRVTGIHGLIRDAKQHYDAGQKVDEGQLLRPYKRLLVDVTASRAGLDKALAFANDLFNALESAGHRVVMSSTTERFIRAHIDEREELPKAQRSEPSYGYRHLWSPQRPTVVYVGSVAFGIAVIEMSEQVELRYVNGKYIRESEYKPPKVSARYVDHTWTTTKGIPCGRIRLVVYAPYRGVDWVAMFQEGKDRPLTKEILAIVRSIEKSTTVVVERVKEEERQAELRERKWQAEMEQLKKEEDRHKVTQSIKESREQLDQVIQAWAKTMSLEQFFEGVQKRAQELPEAQRQEILNRLQLARDFAGTHEPLDFFRSWKTPLERYVPLSIQASGPKREED
jgi:hypothetical protein